MYCRNVCPRGNQRSKNESEIFFVTPRFLGWIRALTKKKDDSAVIFIVHSLQSHFRALRVLQKNNKSEQKKQRTLE
jgi:hypothetical protein